MDASSAETERKEIVARLRSAQQGYKARCIEYAEAERAYRKGKAVAYATRPDGTADERKTWVEAETADLRYVRDLAEGLRQGAIEAIRSARGELSAWQTATGAAKEASALERTAGHYEP